MEQLVIDFFSKSSELILYNRLMSCSSLLPSQNNSQFQLTFDQKFQFSSKVPVQWKTSDNKLLVLEFFLINKKLNEKCLIEQWIFELNQVSNSKLQFTIDSQFTLYKKLSILLRTISVLTNILPLSKQNISNKILLNSSDFSVDYSINFTRHSLSNWHPIVHEENNLLKYSNPDLILPGRSFSFNVNYIKSWSIIQKITESSVSQKRNSIETTLEQLPDIITKSHSVGFHHRCFSAHSERRSTSDTNKNVNSMNEISPFLFNNEEKESIGNLFETSLIETQRSRRKSSLSGHGTIRRLSSHNSIDAPKRPRFYTVESENLTDADMLIYEDDENKITEIITGKELSSRSESPRKFSFHPRNPEEAEYFDINERSEVTEIKLSFLVKPIESILEKNDDDKIAEIINALDKLKLIIEEDRGIAENQKKIRVSEIHPHNPNPHKIITIGFKFSQVTYPNSLSDIEKSQHSFYSDFQMLKAFYNQLKSSN